MDKSRRDQVVQRAATISLVATIVVVTIKLIAAWLSGSIAVLAEGLQSLLDVFISMLALWTIRLAAKPPDEDHPYGHGKAELLSSAFQMVLVVITAGAIAWQATARLYEPRTIEVSAGLWAMAFAVVVNIGLILYLRRTGRGHGSPALLGEAEHLRGDTFASAGILVGLIAYSISGWQILDPLIAIIFTLAGAGFAIRHLVHVLHDLMDGALPASDISLIEAVLKGHADVRGFHNVITRKSGHLRIVSIHVLLDDDLTFIAAHDLAEELEGEMSRALGGAHVTIHFEPYEAELAHRAEAHSDEPILEN